MNEVIRINLQMHKYEYYNDTLKWVLKKGD
jgi:hypothetical protein